MLEAHQSDDSDRHSVGDAEKDAFIVFSLLVPRRLRYYFRNDFQFG